MYLICKNKQSKNIKGFQKKSLAHFVWKKKKMKRLSFGKYNVAPKSIYFGEASLTCTFQPVENSSRIYLFPSLSLLSLKYWYSLSLFSFILYHQRLYISHSSYMNLKYIFNSMAHLLNYSEGEPAELLKKYTIFQNKISSSPISPWLYFFFWFLQKCFS